MNTYRGVPSYTAQEFAEQEFAEQEEAKKLDDLLYGDVGKKLDDLLYEDVGKKRKHEEKDNDKVVAIRRGTRHRTQTQRFSPCQSTTDVPNTTPKQRVKKKIREKNINKLEKSTGLPRHSPNKIWIRDTRDTRRPYNNPFAAKNAWLKKFKQLQTDAKFLERSKAVVENFKKNYTPPKPWDPQMQQYTNLLVSGLQISISKLKQSKGPGNEITLIEIKEIMNKVHKDIGILCVNAFPFGTTIPLLAGKSGIYKPEDYDTPYKVIGLSPDRLLPDREGLLPDTDKAYILEKIQESIDSMLVVDSQSPPNNPFNIDYDNDESFDTLITEADMKAAEGMSPDEITALENELKALGYDINDLCEYSETVAVPPSVAVHGYVPGSVAVAAPVPGSVAVHGYVPAQEDESDEEQPIKKARRSIASGITRRFKKAIGRVRRTSVKKLVPKAPKVFKSRETKKPKTPKNPKKPKKPKSKSQKGGHKRAKHRTQKRHINSATKSCKTKKLYGGHCPSHNCPVSRKH